MGTNMDGTLGPFFPEHLHEFCDTSGAWRFLVAFCILLAVNFYITGLTFLS